MTDSQGAEAPQFSPAFMEKMGGLQNAIGTQKINPFEPGSGGFDFTQLNKPEAPQATPPTTPPVQETTPPATTEPPAVPATGEIQTPSSSDGGVIESPFFGKIKVETPEKAPEQSGTYQAFDSVEGIDKYLATITPGLSVKTLSQELPKIVEKSKQLEEVVVKKEGYENILNNIPEPIYKAIETFGRGGDWRAILKESATALDFEKDFKAQGVENIVEHFVPGKISKEDWDEYNDKNGDETIKDKVSSYIGIAEEKFNFAKQQYDFQKNTYKQNAEKFVVAKKASMDRSKQNALNTFKEIGMPIEESSLSKVDKTMSDEQILSFFKNNDGTFRDDCHQRLIMAEDGFNLVKQYQNVIKRQTASAVRTEVLERTAETPGVTKGGQAGISEAQKQQKKVEDLVAKMAGSQAKQSSVYGE